MRLRDTLRALRGGGADQQLEDAATSTVVEPMRFTPRFDGRYRAVLAGARQEMDNRTDAPDASANQADQGWLRFLGARVYWAAPGTPADQLAAVLGPGADPWVGEYTAAGRFTAQRRFERPVIHTVLSTDQPEPPDDPNGLSAPVPVVGLTSFTARRTGWGEICVLEYTFEPSAS